MKFLHRNAHLGDPTLLLAAEGELSPRTATRVEKHLRACAACRDRQRTLAASESAIVWPAVPATNDVTRNQLVAKLMAQPQRAPWLRLRLGLQVAAAIALLAIAFAFRQGYSPLQDRMAAYEDTGPEPNHALTPGAIRSVEVADLCTTYDADLDPAVSPEKQRAVFQAYGMDAKEARAYQLDYLINPQLGGSDDLTNLWPEPYHATVWNAVAKDALEARLHGLVCSGEVSLDQAQHDLATDWIAAYKKYFHTARPVRTLAELDTSQPRR